MKLRIFIFAVCALLALTQLEFYLLWYAINHIQITIRVERGGKYF